MPSQIFITGASGVVGRSLLESLGKSGDAQFVIYEHKTAVHPPELLAHRCRVTKELDMEGSDSVIHMAAATHAKDAKSYGSVNVEFTGEILKRASKAGVKHFIFVSTTAIGEACGSYGSSKEKAERLVRGSGLPYTIVRLSEIYGGASKEGISQLLNLAKKWPVLPYVKNANLAPLYIADAVHGLSKLCLLPPKQKTYTLAGPESMSFKQVAESICRTIGKKRLMLPVPLWMMRLNAKAPDQAPRLVCEKDYDISQAVLDFGFKPLSFEEGLKLLL